MDFNEDFREQLIDEGVKLSKFEMGFSKSMSEISFGTADSVTSEGGILRRFVESGLLFGRLEVLRDCIKFLKLSLVGIRVKFSMYSL